MHRLNIVRFYVRCQCGICHSCLCVASQSGFVSGVFRLYMICHLSARWDPNMRRAILHDHCANQDCNSNVASHIASYDSRLVIPVVRFRRFHGLIIYILSPVDCGVFCARDCNVHVCMEALLSRQCMLHSFHFGCRCFFPVPRY